MHLADAEQGLGRQGAAAGQLRHLLVQLRRLVDAAGLLGGLAEGEQAVVDEVGLREFALQRAAGLGRLGQGALGEEDPP